MAALVRLLVTVFSAVLPQAGRPYITEDISPTVYTWSDF